MNAKLTTLIAAHTAVVRANDFAEKAGATAGTDFLDEAQLSEWNAFVDIVNFEAECDREFFEQAEYVRHHLENHFGVAFGGDPADKGLETLLARTAARYLLRRPRTEAGTSSIAGRR